jgi:hypothetical protein
MEVLHILVDDLIELSVRDASRTDSAHALSSPPAAFLPGIRAMANPENDERLPDQGVNRYSERGSVRLLSIALWGDVYGFYRSSGLNTRR